MVGDFKCSRCLWRHFYKWQLFTRTRSWWKLCCNKGAEVSWLVRGSPRFMWKREGVSFKLGLVGVEHDHIFVRNLSVPVMWSHPQSHHVTNIFAKKVTGFVLLIFSCIFVFFWGVAWDICLLLFFEAKLFENLVCFNNDWFGIPFARLTCDI
jgi:hypothetical protein